MSTKNTFKLCLVIALTMAATSAFGAATTISGQVQIGGGTFSPSNKVEITYDSGLASSNASSYVAKSKHLSGDRQMATSNADPKMYYKTVAVTTAIESSSSTETFGGTAWTSM